MTDNQITVQAIYAGGRNYQVNGWGYSPEGQFLEVSVAEGKCWLLDINKLYSHIALRECLIAGILCNNSYLEKKEEKWITIGDAIEAALIVAGSKAKLAKSSLEQLMPKLGTIICQSKSQYMATLHQDINHKIIYLKGSLEAVLPRSQQTLDINGNLVTLCSELLTLEAESMREDGLQVLSFAKKLVSTDITFLKDADLENGFIFLGLQGVG